jgi:leader peptidase (prepilin peptidase)/N-methyltransferase
MLTGNAPASYNIVLLFAGFVKGLAVFFPLYPHSVSLFLLYTNFPYFLTHFSKCDTIKQVKKRGICFMYYLCYALLYCIIFAFGAAIGSFLNVCIYRLPKEESLWRNNSHCMTCGTPIRKRDLIPIFSWCRLRGKCHSCGAKIPFRYTLVESLNAVLYVLIYAYFGIFDRPLYAGLVCLFCSALVVVFFMDLDTQLINLYVLGFIGLLGIAATVYDVCTGNSTLLSHFIGAAAASVPLFLLVILSGERAMGRGDAELMLAGGLFLGVKGVVVGLFLGLILGCIFGLIHKAKTGDSRFAFGPYLSAGMALALVVGEPIANLYLQLCGLR